MDPFDELLRGVRADGDDLGRTELSPPWERRFDGGAPLTLCAPLRGEGWLSGAAAEDGEPRLVRAGDVVVVRGPGPFVLSDRPAPGTEPADRTVLLTGTFHARGVVARRLLGVLPPALVVPGDEECLSLLRTLEAQIAPTCQPGQQVVRDRLLDWLLVCTLRAWFDLPEAVTPGPPGWIRALGDEVTGPALRAMHAAPDRSWTLAALAREAGVSRTTLADRFTRLVGEPPLTYLTDWRMALAADLLTESTAVTVASVARRVGYADAFGFSAAFKRFHGASPSEYRRTPRTGADRADAEHSPA
ncbi:AraC family transcriptional regulator [Streptomyces sp. TRM 70361]|uniref:AraC family transcriptional regulator n=1 Tax=Streptomyces sp. TRM 70361 TaxID=3116553 RepID=UPI002E7C1620|nr:AraC family transcriptional regulator [Streptomyces sp. TRM 70361]MEE1940615.1 AraC family transcriptional regulator [Streptomyces sp. TRM 70361]